VDQPPSESLAWQVSKTNAIELGLSYMLENELSKDCTNFDCGLIILDTGQ